MEHDGCTFMDLLRTLQELDFTQYEASVYLELLKKGPSNAGPIVSATGLHRQFVYTALDSLAERGLVSTVVQRNRKLFQAVRPSAILREQEEREARARMLVPQLEALHVSASAQTEVNTFYGREEYWRNLQTIVASAGKSDRVVRIIGGASDMLAYTAIGDNYDEYVRLCAKRKIQKRLIAAESTAADFKMKFATEGTNELRTLRFGLSSPTMTRMTQEMVSIEIYSEPLVVIQIMNPTLAQSYIEHFQLLWLEAIPYHAASKTARTRVTRPKRNEQRALE